MKQPAEDLYPEPEESSINWLEYFHAIRERLWIVALLVMLGVLAGLAYLTQQQPKYSAKSVLLVEKGAKRVLDQVEGVAPEEISGIEMINTMVDTLNSYPFAVRVVESLALNEDPEFLGAGQESTIDPMTGLSPVGAGSSMSISQAANKLRGHVNARYRGQTQLIDIVATHPDNQMAVRLANAFAQEYLEFSVDQRGQKAVLYNDYLKSEAAKQRQAMRLSEEAMQSFRERERSASLESSQAVVEGQLNGLIAEIAQTEQTFAELIEDIKRAEKVKGDPDRLLRIPSVAEEPRVSELTARIAAHRKDFTVLKERYREKHPDYVAAVTTINELNEQLKEVLGDAVTLLKSRAIELRTSLEVMKGKKERLQEQLLEVTSKTVEYNDLRRELDTNRILYDTILERMKEIDVAQAFRDLPFTIHEPAIQPRLIPVQTSSIMTTSVVLGLLSGLGVALGLHFLDRTVKTVDHAERASKLKLLAAIPKDQSVPNTKKITPPITLKDDKGMIAESFRTLRTTLNLPGSKQAENKTFLFTSALPGEGKTFCSSNFAVIQAQAGNRTLLIDVDLRKPMVSQVFYGERKKPGLVEALSGEADWKSCIYNTEQENLNVLPAGRRCERPLEMISGEQIQTLVNELLTHYDRVIFDTPPVLAVSDTHVIAEYTDCIMLVIKSFKTGRKNVERAVQSFEDFERKPRGVILNSLPAGKKSYYYYYSGQYYGSYGSYGEDEQNERKQQKKKPKRKDKANKKVQEKNQGKHAEKEKNTDTVDKRDEGEKDVY